MQHSESPVLGNSVAVRHNGRQRSKVDRDAVFTGVVHDRGMVGVERCEGGIDLRCRVQTAEAALRERPVAFPALRRVEQQIDVVLAACDLVEQVDVVDVRAAIDVIVLWPLPNRPRSVSWLFHR